ncbi:biopolymer transporter ExbD [Nodosilinea sp. E11]|uniref:ExbD/TolR family protein n=1 Tax=Nodosilinea sp. E11 TaxID=3037479 RepID=UPI002934F08F|nr:biopolymer transporter ExbD [Nodosilinea sp. E11]WOD38521.1 biopolymer transporter ExbD [Nodosilinea sp. E11]
MKIDLLDTPSQDVRLEIIPLIDVIFCILTFFILAAVGLTRQQAIDLDLPSADTGQPLPGQVGEGSDRVYVSIDGFGQIYLDQQPVPIEVLRDVLAQFIQSSPSGLIVLYASRDARYEDVVTVLDELRDVGGNRVALATLPRDQTLGPPVDSPDGLPEGFPQESLDGFPDDFNDLPGSDPLSPLSPFPSQPTLPLDPAPTPGQPDN